MFIGVRIKTMVSQSVTTYCQSSILLILYQFLLFLSHVQHNMTILGCLVPCEHVTSSTHPDLIMIQSVVSTHKFLYSTNTSVIDGSFRCKP